MHITCLFQGATWCSPRGAMARHGAPRKSPLQCQVHCLGTSWGPTNTHGASWQCHVPWGCHGIIIAFHGVSQHVVWWYGMKYTAELPWYCLMVSPRNTPTAIPMFNRAIDRNDTQTHGKCHGNATTVRYTMDVPWFAMDFP